MSEVEKTTPVHHESSIEALDIGVDDPAAIRRLTWKIDLRLIPPLWVLFLLAFLDRVNIGNARIQGMPEELRMEGNDYNIALFSFFPLYILCEVPSNLIIKRVPPSAWLSFIMFGWGVITICQGVTQTFAGLVVCRVFLGLFEAGLFPGCVYLISMYYRRYDLQWRLSIFFSSSILAGAFAGLFAYALSKLDGTAGYSSWRWIFIIEGIITVGLALIFYFIIADWPETAGFLNKEERAMLVRHLQEDTGPAQMDRLDKKAGIRILKDARIYLGTLMYFGVVTSSYSLVFFVPTILKEMGYTSNAAQVRSIPIYVVATIMSISAAWITDRMHRRYLFCMFGVSLAVLGYIILLNQSKLHVGVKYMALFFCAGGGFITQPLTIGWLANNMGGGYKRAVSSAVQIGIGNIGGILASNIFFIREAPKYPTGYKVVLGMLILCGTTCSLFYLLNTFENKKRDKGERDYLLELPQEEVENLGDDHPSFRYTL